jgi:hypothetical protein
MKAQINLRSTLNTTTAWQRGSAALAALALMILAGALLMYVSRPSVQSIPRAHVNIPASLGHNAPAIGTGSAYDGGHYVSAAPAEVVLKQPGFGTGSVYDGGHYTGVLPASRVSPNRPVIGTGSAYDGGHYASAAPAENSIKQPGFGTGSVYTGGN